jgi:hypothetical protein
MTYLLAALFIAKVVICEPVSAVKQDPVPQVQHQK